MVLERRPCALKLDQKCVESTERRILEASCGVLSSAPRLMMSLCYLSSLTVSGMRRTHDSHSTCMRRQISGK